MPGEVRHRIWWFRRKPRHWRGGGNGGNATSAASATASGGNSATALSYATAGAGGSGFSSFPPGPANGTAGTANATSSATQLGRARLPHKPWSPAPAQDRPRRPHRPISEIFNRFNLRPQARLVGGGRGVRSHRPVGSCLLPTRSLQGRVFRSLVDPGLVLSPSRMVPWARAEAGRACHSPIRKAPASHKMAAPLCLTCFPTTRSETASTVRCFKSLLTGRCHR